MIEVPGHSTKSSFQQQAGMVRFFAQMVNASIAYVKEDDDRAIAIVTLPSGEIHRFNVYGAQQ